MVERIPMTPEGHRKLKDELDNLIKVQRPENIKAIAEARAHGDLSENAEYHAAKERQSFIEGRITELQDRISRAEIIDTSRVDRNKVAFGATVQLLDIDTDEVKTFRIVGTEEADVASGMISFSSPVAKALIGKSVGDEATIKAPARTIQYEITSISY